MIVLKSQLPTGEWHCQSKCVLTTSEYLHMPTPNIVTVTMYGVYLCLSFTTIVSPIPAQFVFFGIDSFLANTLCTIAYHLNQIKRLWHEATSLQNSELWFALLLQPVAHRHSLSWLPAYFYKVYELCPALTGFLLPTSKHGKNLKICHIYALSHISYILNRNVTHVKSGGIYFYTLMVVIPASLGISGDALFDLSLDQRPHLIYHSILVATLQGYTKVTAQTGMWVG